MTFIIRQARETDALSLIALRRRLFEETSYMLWEPGEFKQTEDDERGRIIRLNRQPNSLILLAEAGKQLVGVLSATGDERNQLRHTSVLSVGVVRSHWSQGIASRMVQDAVTWSLTAGLKRLELTVHGANIRAVSVYMRYGFEVEGLRRSSLLVDGKYINEYLMALIHSE